jgi:integrase
VIAAKGFLEANKRKLELDRLDKKRYYSIPRKKVLDEIIPNKEQAYKMADASLSLKAGLRNRAIILCLLQSGVRPGCLCRWTYQLVKDHLYPEVRVPVKLVINSETDTKLQSYGLDYYITFLQREAAEALKSYLDSRVGHGWRFKSEDPVFVTESTASRGKPLKTANIWEVIKQVAPAAGIESDRVWSRLVRKSFRKVLNQSDIDEDTKEAIMGHKLPGSRGNYFDSHDHDEIASKYMRCQFDRSTPGSSEEAAKKAVMAVMKAQYGDRLTAEKMKELERILPMTASADEIAELMARMIVEEDKTEKRTSKTSKAAYHGAQTAAPFETRIVDEQALLPLLNGGWDVVRELADRRIIVRRPNGVGG